MLAKLQKLLDEDTFLKLCIKESCHSVKEFQRDKILKGQSGQDYGIVRIIGEGAYGVVYLVERLQFEDGRY